MTSQRRRAPADAEMRGKLIAAAEAIIREQGYGALTARTLAERLGLKRQIVHYYFESMDELLTQVVLASHEQSKLALVELAASEDPLRAIWTMSSNPEIATLALELAVLAARRPAVREVVRSCAEEHRALQTRILVDHLAARGIAPQIDPELAVFVLTAMSQTMVQEDAVGITFAHEKVLASVDGALGEFATTGGSSRLR